MTNSLNRPGLLANKIAVITGAANGIGQFTTELFVREGACVVAADLSDRVESVAAPLGSAAVSYRCDVRDESQVRSMFARALEIFGRVDALINVAGTPGGRRRAGEMTLEDYEHYTAVNLRAVVLCNQHAVKTMLPTGGGAIVNVSSVASLNADPQISGLYAAAKAGVNAVTKALALQYGASGIRANAVAPGFTLSSKNQVAPPDIMRVMSAKAMLQRAGEPAEQAEVIAFLASDRASYINGAIIPVDGGWAARLA